MPEGTLYHTTRPRKHLVNNGSSFRTWSPRLVPSIGVILLTVTSQGWQNTLQKADPLTLGRRYGVAMILCNKMDISFGANVADFCRASYIYYKLVQ